MSAGPAPTGRATLVVAVVAGLAALAGAARALLPAFTVAEPTAANRALVPMQDFRDATYFPVREFLAGGDPYQPDVMLETWPVRQTFNLYQPYHLALHLPFGLGSYTAGAAAFALVSLALLVLLAVLSARELRRWVPVPVLVGTAVVAALLLSSQLGKAQLYLGQINPLVAVGAAGALVLTRTHPAWAAAALGVAWIKPQFGLPLALLLAARGSWRTALGGTGIAALASLPVVGILVARAGGVGGFLHVIAANLGHAQGTTYGAVDSPIAERVDVAAVVFRVTGSVPSEAFVLVAVLGATAVLARLLDRREDPVLGDLLVGVGVVVALVHQPGDVLIALPAAVGAAGWWWVRRHEHGAARLVPVALLLMAVPHLHLYAVDVPVRAALGDRFAVTVDGVALVACWAVLVALAVLRVRRAAPVPVAVSG
ncbi:glycosyltransferase family 87 protein [Pseudonocardia broussonetiae]|nr:glycosyltransferase family 87 protein [Pseudonocardia broussonetiae]